MDRQRLKEVIRQLKDITFELESEVWSDVDKYTEGPNIMIGDDNDGEPD